MRCCYGSIRRWRHIKGAKKGAIALPPVIIISLIILIGGIGILGTGLSEHTLTFGERESREALYGADAGAHDAMMRIARDITCNTGGVPSCASYSFSVGNALVSVTVSGGAIIKTITATGTRQNKTRTLSVTIVIDVNNKATITSWSEQT